MLVDKVKEEKVQNWMKSVLAINKTTEVLRPAVKERFEQFISGLPDLEKEHLEIFYQCLTKNDVVYFKYSSMQKNADKSWECTHHLCQNLMKRLLDNFENGSQKHRWKFNITKPVGPVEELDKSTQTHNQEQDGKWNLMKLFMYGETDKIPRSSLNDLDLSQTIKLMRSCTLFTITEDSVSTFEQALKSRNQLMHSTDNEINNADTSRIFEELTKLVDLFVDKTSNQQEEVVEDLHKLRDTNLFKKEETREYQDLASKVLRIKAQALELDISLNQNLTEKSKTQSQNLVRMLNETTAETAVLDYEINLDTISKQTEELQKRIDATKQQQEKLREEKKRQKSELKKLETNVATERGVIDDISNSIHQTKQQHKKLRVEKELQQSQLNELEPDVVKDCWYPLSQVSLSSQEEVQTNYRDTLEDKTSENRDDEVLYIRHRKRISKGPSNQTRRHEKTSFQLSSRKKETDEMKWFIKSREERLNERRERRLRRTLETRKRKRKERMGERRQKVSFLQRYLRKMKDT